jgi:hypothetical protein
MYLIRQRGGEGVPRACCYRAMTCVGVCLLVRGGVSVLLTAGASSRHRFVAAPVRELVTSLLKYHRRTVVRAGLSKAAPGGVFAASAVRGVSDRHVVKVWVWRGLSSALTDV